MDLSVDEFLEGFFKPETLEQPSDTVKESELVLELPPWYDEKKYKAGQKFFWDNVFGQMTSFMSGLLAVIAVPSILRILVGTKRSSNAYTAYRRYISTNMHVVSWHEHDLVPGSVAWKSLHAVRSRHLRAGLQGRLMGKGTVSQRDVALTQFGFMGFTVLRPDKLGIWAQDEDSWEGCIHFWRTICYMIGLEDRYNICRKNIYETRQVCQVILDRVHTPCLENVPEYFDQMATSIVDGLWAINPNLNIRSFLYFTKNLADVPGYAYTEEERMRVRDKIANQLKNKSSFAEGVDAGTLVAKPLIDGLPPREPSILRTKDFELLENVPAYKKLGAFDKFMLHFLYFGVALYKTNFGKWYFNMQMRMTFWLKNNFPYLAFPRFGYKNSFVDKFEESIGDDTVVKTNKEFRKRHDAMPWYIWLWPFGTNWLYR